MRTTITRTLSTALLLATAACAELPSGAAGSAASPPDAALEGVALSLDAMADEASRSGDALAATEYADGALALRLGAQPTEIAVTIRGQGYRYYAVVTGVVERHGSGPELLRRTVVAWNRMDRPDAILRLTSRADAATFGHDESLGDLGRATGSWVDLTRGHRFAAVDGGVATTLNSLAGRCPAGQSDTRFTCQLARFGLRMEGVFELVGDATARVEIATESSSIAGVVVQRSPVTTDRPTVTPSRPETVTSR